jgi:hypothetical protein
VNHFLVIGFLIAIVAGCGSSAPAASPSPAATPGATPSPASSPALLARGNFVEHDFGPVEFEATRVGSSVTGRMTFSERDGWGPVAVDLQCVRATEDGIVMIGGYITVGNQIWSEGTLAMIALRRGSPNRAVVRAGSIDVAPATQTGDCLAYLNAWLQLNRAESGGTAEWVMRVRGGTVEVGP